MIMYYQKPQARLPYYTSRQDTYRTRLEQGTVWPGSSDPPEKIFDIFASESEVLTIVAVL